MTSWIFSRLNSSASKRRKYKGAVLLAVHHPPYTYMPPPKKGTGGDHCPSVVMLSQIDEICLKQGIYPHAVLFGACARLSALQPDDAVRWLEIDVPFIVCGDGGHNVNPLVRAKNGQPAVEPHPGSRVDYMEWKNAAVTAKELWLEKYNDTNYGYLRIHVDEKELAIGSTRSARARWRSHATTWLRST